MLLRARYIVVGVVALIAAQASDRASAGDLTFADVPRVTAVDPAIFRDVFERARTEIVRVAVFGDSQETAPNGWGVHYLAHINAGFARLYGPTGESTLLSNTTSWGAPHWLASMRESEAVAAASVPPSSVLPGVFVDRFFLGEGVPFDALRTVFLHDASDCIDPTLEGGAWFDAQGPIVADVLAIARPKSPGLRWSNAPTNSDNPDLAAPVVQSGVFNFKPKTAAGTHVWFTTPTLDFAARRHLQVALRGDDSILGTDIVGLRYRSQSAHRGVTVQSYSAGGLRLPQLIEQFGESGALLRALAPSVVVLHYGANDAANGITMTLWRSQLLATIVWIRQAMQNPTFPIIIAAELRIGSNSTALALLDRMPVVAHEIALADSHVLALNQLRVTNEEYGWGPRPDAPLTGTWMPYLADSAHYRPYAQRLLGLAFVGELARFLSINDPACASPNWADCVRSWGATCELGGCTRIIDHDAVEHNLYWGGVGTNCDDANADGVADLCWTPAEEDINSDGIVDAGDMAILLGAWGQNYPPADLNGDGTIGASDLARLLAAWGT